MASLHLSYTNADSACLIHYSACICRRMNIHLINTLGVGPADIAKCIECWCDNVAAFQQNYHGGTACCSPNDCPTPRAKEPPTVYYLQYNVSYRWGTLSNAGHLTLLLNAWFRLVATVLVNMQFRQNKMQRRMCCSQITFSGLPNRNCLGARCEQVVFISNAFNFKCMVLRN